MELKFGQRLNLLTGDNGLGKSFLLDIAWWALTRKWPAEVNSRMAAGLMARPGDTGSATIRFAFTAKSKRHEYQSDFDRKVQAWTGPAGRPPNPGLVIYAQVDGSFAVWDPARNYWRKRGNADVQERPSAYVFTARDVWDGLPGLNPDGRPPLCNGVITDWAGWQKEAGPAYDRLRAVLDALSPSDEERIVPGSLTRISLDDPRDIPTLKMPYGQDVPLLHASAGIRRVVALAYLLVWAWEEHIKASKLLGVETTEQIVFLIDEIEAHLHPKWQRRITRSLLDVVTKLAPQVRVQLLAATHSPLVMASVEPLFDDAQDAWFDLDLRQKEAGQPPEVELTRRPLIRRGDASNWLMSQAFDMRSARSVEAEQAIEAAASLLSSNDINTVSARALDGRLRQVLGDTDPF